MLSLPPAFVLSQDQTLMFICNYQLPQAVKPCAYQTLTTLVIAFLLSKLLTKTYSNNLFKLSKSFLYTFHAQTTALSITSNNRLCIYSIFFNTSLSTVFVAEQVLHNILIRFGCQHLFLHFFIFFWSFLLNHCFYWKQKVTFFINKRILNTFYCLTLKNLIDFWAIFLSNDESFT